MTFKIKLQGQEITMYIPILGEHHVYNALNAIAVADTLGFSPIDIQAGLNFKKNRLDGLRFIIVVIILLLLMIQFILILRVCVRRLTY